MNTKTALGAAAALALVAIPASAQLVGAGDVDVRFLAKGPAGMKINGTAEHLKATEAGGDVKVTVPVTALKTGIGLRDKHLRGYIEAEKHPSATLVIERSKLTFPENGREITKGAQGALTLHGVTKPMKFTYKAKRTGSDYHVQALAKLDIRDFNVEVPCYLGVCVDPEVQLKVRFKLREK